MKFHIILVEIETASRSTWMMLGTWNETPFSTRDTCNRTLFDTLNLMGV